MKLNFVESKRNELHIVIRTEGAIKVGRFVTRQRIALEQSSHAGAVLINRFTVKFANCDAVRSNPAGL
jgi:hypothetical protein